MGRQKKENTRRQQQAKYEEGVLVAKMKEKFRQDDERAEKKRLDHKQLEENYKQEIHQQMKTRSEFFAAAQVADNEQQRVNANRREFEERVVEEARKAILREHA